MKYIFYLIVFICACQTGKDWVLLLDKIYIFGEQTDSICFQPLHFAFAKQQSVKYK